MTGNDININVVLKELSCKDLKQTVTERERERL